MDTLLFKAQDLKKQGLIDKTTTEFVFQGRLLKKGQLFSKRFRQVAINTCEEKLNAGKFCLVVEGEIDFAIWEEKTVTPLSQSSHLQAPPPPPLLAKPATSETEFLHLCQQELAEFVGPIADYILEETLKKYPQLTPKQMVEALAREIPSPEQAEEFKQRMQA